MSRKEAIGHMLMLNNAVDSEFSCSETESEEAWAEFEAAMKALGVSEAEINDA